MTERTTYLDRDPCHWRSRKIRVRASRWYATVVLDRDSYVDAATSLGHDPELPDAYREALDRAWEASTERIWRRLPGRLIEWERAALGHPVRSVPTCRGRGRSAACCRTRP